MTAAGPAKRGDIIDGKYKVEESIGEGGMGAVFSARHQQLDQLVAIKFLTSDSGGVVAAERFLREARAAARIRSDFVCRVLDIGEIDDGTPYMVMEYLEGRDLSDELATRGRIPAAEAVSYALDACEGLKVAHAAGIIHRDLKPGNLFRTSLPDGRPRVKVVDFGVSKMLDPDSGDGLALTATTTLVGSPLYMSPEQLESSRNVDARTDVWALGVVLYELIAGSPPFMAETVPQLVNAVLHGEIKSFAEHGVSVPAGLEAVAMRALSRDRDERYADIAAFSVALWPFVSAEFRSSRASALGSEISADAHPAVTADAGPARASTARTGSSTPSHWERESRPEGGRGRSAWFVLMAVAVVVGLAVAFLFQRDSNPDVAASEPGLTPAATTPAGSSPPEGFVPAPAGPKSPAEPSVPGAVQEADVATPIPSGVQAAPPMHAERGDQAAGDEVAGDEAAGDEAEGEDVGSDAPQPGAGERPEATPEGLGAKSDTPAAAAEDHEESAAERAAAERRRALRHRRRAAQPTAKKPTPPAEHPGPSQASETGSHLPDFGGRR